MPTAVEVWTAAQLTHLGVDSVFAPYVLGMLCMEDGPTLTEDDEVEDAKRQEVLDLLMGWLDDSHQTQVENFVDELILYVKNPSQLELLHDAASVADNADATADEEELAQLDATASTFVPVPRDEPPAIADHPGAYDVDVDNEDAFYWSVAYELVEQLLLEFPAMDPERLLDLLKEVDLNVHRAQVRAYGVANGASFGHGAHLYVGITFKATAFLHDTHLIPCRYWIRGGCLQGDECAFAHSFAVAMSQYSSCASEAANDVEESDEPLEWNFPALQGGTSHATNATDAKLSLDFKRAVAMAPAPPSYASNSWFGATTSSGVHERQGLLQPDHVGAFV
ncbi:hypothetical protein DYB32_002935 [Aphanomyces invadans]|uniref:C3H1-type domain-containing protein n=1 Tax=Aphanomyces invadans TaxID=157072 RepID=A0A3R6WPT3_9STRA|nr:hypothetical protein DYB32_002935 [Aphanomyces invadans]